MPSPAPRPARPTPRRPLDRRAIVTAGVGLLGVLLTAGCTGSRPAAPVDVTSTVVVSSTAPATTITPVSEAPIPPAGPVDEVPGTCPWIDTQAAADAEGDRVGRVTLTTTDPPGCNFYFQYDSSRMVLQISVENYPSQTGAYNAMVRNAGPAALGVSGLVPGVDAVLFQTAFYPPDGNRDWACAFAAHGHVVTVRTQQNDVSFNARSVAAQIAPRF